MVYRMAHLEDLKSICVSGKRTCKKKKKKPEGSGYCANPRDLWLLSRVCVRRQPHPASVGSSSSCVQGRKICSLFLSPLPNPTHCSFLRVKTSHSEAKENHTPSSHSQLLAYDLHSWGHSKA